MIGLSEDRVQRVGLETYCQGCSGTTEELYLDTTLSRCVSFHAAAELCIQKESSRPPLLGSEGRLDD